MKTPALPIDLDAFKDYRKRSRVFISSSLVTAVIITAKAIVSYWDLEPFGFSSLYSTIITGGFFVIGFILSATIADYKESEKFPSEFAAIVENMYEDARSISMNYPDFAFAGFHEALISLLRSTKGDLVTVHRQARHDVHDLSDYFVQMETAGVPPNFITKLKQEQALLTRMLFRSYYIQTIRFIPSAFLLARIIVTCVIGLLLLTDLETPSASLWLTGVITFIMVYVLLLIRTISTPFHKKGVTRDDVSLFLIDRAADHLAREIGDTE